MYIVEINQGDFLQLRGGNDWGRSSQSDATQFPTKQEAQAWADNVRPVTGKAKVVPADEE